jgi:aldehyde:ferredoxin oxidoreductase
VRPIEKEVVRFRSMYAWANRILRIDLSNMDIEVQEAESYLPEYLGARGIAARICWQEYAEPVEPFGSSNPLMIFPGALTGSRSPYSGRSSVCTFSPQAYPHSWFTRSNVGGYFGAEVKRAGYDGIVVTGAAETPVRVRIRDDGVSILPADDLWGLDTMDTTVGPSSEAGPLKNVCANWAWRMCMRPCSTEQKGSNEYECPAYQRQSRQHI